MYDVNDYDAMFADGVRTAAYLAAIERAVRPESVVVEIGTGVGFFAVAACRAGARRVYAIETNPAVELAAGVAADNGCADRITFIRADSRSVTVRERGDVLLSDLRGVLPAHGEHIPVIVDARTRLVRPDAILVPKRDALWVAPTRAPADWTRDHIGPGDAPHGISRRAVADRVRADWHPCHLGRTDLLADGVEWAGFAYERVESPDLEGAAGWIFETDGVADGLAIWFDTDLGFGASMSNAPSAPRALYGQAFFPFERSLAVRAGDRLDVELAANLVSGDYCWRWNSTLAPGLAGAPPVSFRQSNLAARVVSLDRLREIMAAREGKEESASFPHTPSTA